MIYDRILRSLCIPLIKYYFEEENQWFAQHQIRWTKNTSKSKCRKLLVNVLIWNTL